MVYKDIDEEETVSFLRNNGRRTFPSLHLPASLESRTQVPRYVILLLSLLTVLSWCLSLLLLLRREITCTAPILSTTDFEPMRSAIEYENRTYNGGLNYDPDKQQLIWEMDESKPRYVGLPSRDVDDAWAELLKGEYAALTLEEAKPYIPEGETLMKLPNDRKYHFEPAVMHNLHCLNAVRVQLDHEYYMHHGGHYHHSVPEKYTSHLPDGLDFDRVHIDHCLEQLRNAVMCAGDLTPVLMYMWSDGFPLALGRGANHTCRKWEPLREWYDERIKSHGAMEGDGTVIPSESGH